ncbi:peptidoglycan/LPS O-acetylase OafA/YrhL [Streptomyces sp. SAI-208]|uniref:acyltransferase family protein n=1 Tax=unclassified Streptomyces TaxID=2593676 RepID=UPI00247334E7|nr:MULTISPECIES: acyltransferase [unclassified Streptomyces]MDH6517703.1 peptidoglycan/LPS O-acetylase OafA/YrhL [Streptomyces sp. SAI-090]MDH6549926.1 peptidoglycan/LPS O-acetylase OafA/YrhL [Streptomyces sp. SAI-041]MDH6568978.1 peptidoglycan/LPS O-acetylase OafA/YrhL [Streptomyces sp. SAI-117]MDH6586068.1 peptidoglycan/LPS O-acetylase OafA/YrhL [Streptomyces sp. SAI-133]MDH6608563.1 peptidoglycan/LPS O-acetylase OafA/YrhL [Streptomyces sp. SAI-208]
MSRTGRVSGLDGLRTLAVALVVVHHVEPDLLPGGAVAVDVFFTISGFVITRLLIAEYVRRGGISLTSFYRRRWLRLVPAMLAVCAFCVLIASTTTLWGFRGSLQAAGLTAAFLTNVVRAMEPGPYSELTAPLAHTWSLGVEEQFYLLWPLVLLLLLRRLKARTVLLCTAALCVLPLLWRCVLWNPDAAHRIYNGTDTRADQLLAGALVAVALARLRADDPRLALLRTWSARLAWPALALLGLVAWQVPVTEDLGAWTTAWYTIGFLAVAVLSAGLVTALELRPEDRLSRLLALTPLSWVGRNLSYGIYLWHYPVVRLLASLGVNEGRLAATAVLTLLMALLSHYAIEKPFLKRAHPTRPLSPALATAT